MRLFLVIFAGGCVCGRWLVVLLPFESVVAERVSRSRWNNVNNRHMCHERAIIMSGCLNLSNHTFNDLRRCDWLICCDCWITSTPSGGGLQPQTFDEGNSTTTFDARKLFAVLILPRRLMMGNSRCDLVAEWLQCALRAEILLFFAIFLCEDRRGGDRQRYCLSRLPWRLDGISIALSFFFLLVYGRES